MQLANINAIKRVLAYSGDCLDNTDDTVRGPQCIEQGRLKVKEWRAMTRVHIFSMSDSGQLLSVIRET